MRDELVELEHGFWDAAGDGDYYAEHMHEEGLCLLPVGAMDKASTIEAITTAQPWSSHSFADITVHQHTSEVAVLTYTATGMREGSDDIYEALIATTYLRNRDSWKMLIHQQTPLITPS